MATKSLFLRKIKDIRYKYGDAAVEYFKSMPYCERCPEKRLVCLSIHHVHGKNEDVFETLCHNCHASYHAGPSGSITYEHELEWVEQKKKLQEALIDRNKKIITLEKEGLAASEIANLFNLSTKSVRKILKNGINCQDQSELESL